MGWEPTIVTKTFKKRASAYPLGWKGLRSRGDLGEDRKGRKKNKRKKAESLNDGAGRQKERIQESRQKKPLVLLTG